MDFKKQLEKRVKGINEAINQLLPGERNAFGELVEAMNYSVVAQGKRIRPVLMGETYRIYGGNSGEIKYFQAAMECIHTSSLVHDDLPALDNDMYRRGKKTTHAQYGEALGILTGDALLNLAYELLLKGVRESDNKEMAIKAASLIAEKSGYRGMLGGQDVDVEDEKKGIKGDTIEKLNFIYEKKTAALLEASLMAGAAFAGAPDKDIELLEKIGRKIGVAFQIQDDVLDVTGTTSQMGKSVFSDMKNMRETYVTILGVEEAVERVRELSREALTLVKELPGDTSFLQDLIVSLADRKK